MVYTIKGENSQTRDLACSKVIMLRQRTYAKSGIEPSPSSLQTTPKYTSDLPCITPRIPRHIVCGILRAVPYLTPIISFIEHFHFRTQNLLPNTLMGMDDACSPAS